VRTLLELGLGNAVVATLLALAAWGVSRRWHRPALAHGLWLLVLVKLVTPPLVPLSVPWVVRATVEEPAPAVTAAPAPKPVAFRPPPASRAPAADPAPLDEATLTGSKLAVPSPSKLINPEEPTDDPAAPPPGEPGSRGDNDVPAGAADSGGAEEEESPPAVAPATPTATPAVPGPRPRLSAGEFLAGVWVVGAVGWFLLVAVRVLSFHRLLRHSQPAPRSLRRSAARLARAVGLRRRPGLRLVPGALPPMIWAAAGRPILLFPQELLARLRPEQCDTLLLHELAHLKRRDHWVRWLELLTAGLYWWLPVAWWARRELQKAEEECCDAWVVGTLPSAARTYAAALLDTIDFLAAARPCLPPAASGVGQFGLLKRRLTMILHGGPARRLPLPARLAFLALAAGLLPLVPTPAQPKPKPSEPPPGLPGAAEEPPVPDETGEPLLFEARPVALHAKPPTCWSMAVSPDGSVVAVVTGGPDRAGEAVLWDVPAKAVLKRFAEPKGARSVAVSADGRWLAVGGFDGRVQVRDIDSGNVVGVALGHSGAVTAVAFAGGRDLWTAGEDGTARRWDLTSPGDENRLPERAVCRGHDGAVTALALTDGDQTVCTAGTDGSVRAWAAETGKEERRLCEPGRDPVTALAVVGDGKQLAVARRSGAVVVLNRADGASQPAQAQGAAVLALAAAPEGSGLAAGGIGGGWAREDGKVRFALDGHASPVRGLGFDRAGKALVSVGEDGVIKIRGWADGKELATLRDSEAESAGPRTPLFAVAYSPDEKLLAAAGEDKLIRVWDLSTRQMRAALTGHSDLIAALAFSPDSKTLASAGYDHTVKLWDVATGKERATCTGHTNWVTSLAFSPDGKTLASGGFERAVRLWDAATGRPGPVLSGHTAGVRAVAFSPDGHTVASGSGDRTVRVWDVPEGKLKQTLKGHTGTVRGVAFVAGGKQLASAGEDKTVRLWDLATGQERASLSGHAEGVWALAVSQRGGTLASGSWDGQVRLWDVRSARPVRSLAAHSDGVTALAFAPDGAALATVGLDQQVKLWPAAAPPAKPRLIVRGHKDPVTATAVTPDGSLVASGDGGGAVRITDTATGREVRVLSGHKGGVKQLRVSPDGRLLASAGNDKLVRLWEVSSGRELHVLSGHGDSVLAVAFAPDGKTLASGGRDKTARLWDVTGGRELRSLTDHKGAVAAVQFSADGKLLFTAGQEVFIRGFDVAGGARKFQFSTGAQGRVDALALSPDGRTLAYALTAPAAAPPGPTRRDPEGMPMPQPPAPPPNRVGFLTNLTSGSPAEDGQSLNHPDEVTSLAFSSDGLTLLTACRDQSVRYWDWKAATARPPVRAHPAPVTGLALAADGRTLATAGDDGTVRLWDAATTPQVGPRLTLRAGRGPAAARVAPDGRSLALGGPEGAQLHGPLAELGTAPARFGGSYGPVLSVAVSHDGRRVATAHNERVVRVWDAATGAELRTLSGHTQRVWAVAFSPDGKVLVSASGNFGKQDEPGQVKLWDVAEGKFLRDLPGQQGMVWALAFSPDGKHIASGGSDRTVRLWDATRGKLVRSFEGAENTVREVAFAPDSSWVACAGFDGTLRRWETQTGQELTAYDVPEKKLGKLAVSPDGRLIAVAANPAEPPESGPEHGQVLIWDVKDGVVRQTLTHEGRVLAVQFTPDGKTVIAAGGSMGKFGEVRFWDVGSGAPVGELHGHRDWVESVAVSRDGRTLYTSGGSGNRPGELRAWSLAGLSGAALQGTAPPAAAAFAYSDDGQRLATVEPGRPVRVWDAASGKELFKLPERSPPAHAALFASGGEWLAVGAEDGTVTLWEVPRWGTHADRPLRTLGPLAGPVRALALAPDGRRLAVAAGANGTHQVKFWDAADGREVGALAGLDREVLAVSFSADGLTLATVQAGGALRLWDLAARKERSRREVGDARLAAFSRDGTRLAVAVPGAEVRVWDAAAGRELAVLVGHADSVTDLAFAADARTLVSAASDGAVKFWDLPAKR
jgi:WD40 repeat protein/beta-lactamase regulating signal transducer with metallopeptidase domain